MATKQTGIYLIICKANNKIYVGATIDLKGRYNRHSCDLKNGNHGNPQMQSDFDKYGKTEFEFVVLQRCGKEDLDRFEHYYFGVFDTLDPLKGYNIWGAGRKGRTAPEHIIKNNLDTTGKPSSPLSWKRLKEIKSKKVIDKKTGIIYETIVSACEQYGYNASTASTWLNGIRENKSSLEFYKSEN